MLFLWLFPACLPFDEIGAFFLLIFTRVFRLLLFIKDIQGIWGIVSYKDRVWVCFRAATWDNAP